MLTPSSRLHFQTLLDALVLQTDLNPGPEAIVYVETDKPTIQVSRRQFRETVSSYAAGMKKIGLKPGELVVIAHTQNLESIYAFWGAMLVGAIPSMFPTLTEKLNAEIYMRNLAELVQLSDVRMILTTDDFAPELQQHVTCQTIGSHKLARSITKADVNEFVPHQPDQNEIAFLQHSSGTTGLQKGVALSHSAVLNQLANYGQAIQLNPQDVIVSWLPLYHDMGLIAGFLLPLVQGIPLVLMSPFDWVRHPALLFQAIHDQRGTLCWLPNFAYNHCARRIRQRDTDGLSLEGMRLFVNCSEPVYHESHQLFLRRFAPNGLQPEMLSVSFAMAENTFGVTQTPPGQPANLDIINRSQLEREGHAQPVPADHPQADIRVSCGPPIRGTTIRVVDDAGRSLPERTVGEVAIQSDCMLAGYYKRPDLDPFQDGWYLTGDMGYLAGGEVYIVGRSKDLIINAGKNIYPQDIEAIVNRVPGVHPGRCVVFGVPDEREGTELIAVVAQVRQPSDLEDLDRRQTIGRAIRQEVARQSLVTVSYVHLVGPKWLIKTSSGKIARSANREKWLAEKQPKIILPKMPP
ncbi:MAG: AMP-binding protein [Chloroflexota bacterium]